MTAVWSPTEFKGQEKSETQFMFVLFYFCRNERNVIEAAAKGASTAIALVANIAANLIAFLAFLAFFNGVLSWLGSMVGKPELSF